MTLLLHAVTDRQELALAAFQTGQTVPEENSHD